MKKFVLTFVSGSRLDPGKVVMTVTARNAKEARTLASGHTVKQLPNKNIWLDPKQTSCRGYKTTRRQTGVESITTC